MQDTLFAGDIALVTRFETLGGAPPGRGQVVQCRFAGRDGTYIKRVVGMPGEEIRFLGAELWVNGEAVSEPYVSSPSEDYAIALGEDEYLVLGDNRAESYDSRMADMGPVGRDAFLGRVRLVIWPLWRIGAVR